MDKTRLIYECKYLWMKHYHNRFEIIFYLSNFFLLQLFFKTLQPVTKKCDGDYQPFYFNIFTLLSLMNLHNYKILFSLFDSIFILSFLKPQSFMCHKFTRSYMYHTLKGSNCIFHISIENIINQWSVILVFNF